MPAFDSIQIAAFDGLEFAIESCDVRGGVRDHVHEYPHVQGGSPELMGRKLYEVEMKARFDVGLVRFPSSWPDDLQSLREKFENQTIGPLVIPTVGTINAYCVDWSQQMTAEVLSGETASFKFREDSEDLTLGSLVVVDANSIDQQAQDFAIAVDDAGIKSDLFDSIKDLSNAIGSIKDQGEAFQNQVEAKCLALAAACQKADATVRFLNDPINHRVVESIHVLWESATKLHNDVQRKQVPIIGYTVPQLMGVGAISKALYGTSARGGDILRLNGITDPFAIPANTKLRVYEAA